MVCWVLGFILSLVLSAGLVVQAGAQTDWAVWKLDSTYPGQVSVAPTGSINPPWYVDSVWHSDVAGALKKACWLVRSGDIQGRRYFSADMNAGRVVCDLNCNCQK